MWRRDLALRSLESLPKEREAEKGGGAEGGGLRGGEDECYSDCAGVWGQRCAFVRPPVRFCVFMVYILCMYSRCVYMILCAALAHRCIIAVYLCVCIGLHMGVNFLMHMLLHSDIDETYTHMHTCVQTSTEGTIESDGAGGGDLVWRTALTTTISREDTTISREDTTCAIKAGHDRQKEENLQASGAPWQVVALATITSSSSTFTCASLFS